MDQSPADFQSSSDQAGASPYSANQDPRNPNFSSSAAPAPEYNLPPSARSGTFPDYIQQQRQQQQQSQPQQTYSPQGPPAQGGNMAHAQNPTIAAASPTYPPHPQYPPHAHQFPPHEAGGMYPMTPAEYAARQWPPPGHYPPPSHMPHYPHPSGSGPPSTPGMISPGGHPMSTVYSFVPIPGAQQHKRPRRRYEEIERMYKCGWSGCEKAYGTLNHLNAHVTMQSHGAKRTPEEFKEIRKEWKAKKKEEEAARKADDDRHRTQVDERGGHHGGPSEQQGYGQMRGSGGPQLPPIGYAASSGPPASGQYAQQSPGMDGTGMTQYARAGPGYGSEGGQGGNYPPQSPYGQPGQQMR